MIPEVAEIRSIVLDLVKVAIQRSVSLREMHFSRNRMEAEAMVGYTAEELVVRLQTAMLGGDKIVSEKPVTFTWHASWWQHTKDRWFPGWLKKRFPVEFITRTVVQETIIQRVCPHIDIPAGHGNVMGQVVHLDWLLPERRVEAWKKGQEVGR